VTFEERVGELERALERLDEALALGPAPSAEVSATTLPEAIVGDAAIQRFEFSFELAWKALSGWLERNLTAPPASPRAVLREAYRQGVIADEARWIALLLDQPDLAYLPRSDRPRRIRAPPGPREALACAAGHAADPGGDGRPAVTALDPTTDYDATFAEQVGPPSMRGVSDSDA